MELVFVDFTCLLGLESTISKQTFYLIGFVI